MSEKTLHLAFKPKSSYEKDAVRIVQKLQKHGQAAFFVGGFARDLLMKRKRADIDIASSATPWMAKKMLLPFRVIDRDKKFGTLRVIVEGGTIELTTFRSEEAYEDRRRPGQVSFIHSAEDDARRRDFTINGMFYDPTEQMLYDFVGGIDDIKKKIIRCIGDPKKRFSEDALRMLRAFRFQAQTGYAIEPKTLAALRKTAPFIQEIASERVRSEIEKLLLGNFSTTALRDMHASHLMKYVMPEIFLLSTVKQNPLYHAEGDVFTHTMMVLDALPKDADISLRLAALFHDVGKAKTTKEVRENGKRKIVSYNHEVEGANMIQRILGQQGLRFDNLTIKKVEWLVRNHMVMYQLKDMRMAKQMAYATHKWFPELLELDRADDLGRMSKDHDPLIPYKYGKKMLRRAEVSTNNKPLDVFLKTIVTGNDIKEILEIPGGPRVGNILREIRQLFYQGKITTRKQAIAHLLGKKKVIQGGLEKKKQV